MTSRRKRAALALGALAVAAAAAVLLIATAPSSPSPSLSRSRSPRPALAPSAGESFGVNVNLLFNDFAYTPAQIGAQLAAVRATGATVARSDALWEATEPHAPAGGRHRYDWRFDDAIAGSLAAHGLTWLPILDYTAPWAESIPGDDHSPPRADADYAAYAAAFVERYGPGGAFWRAHPELTARPVGSVEIWNEPDGAHFWQPAPNAAAYDALYTAARDAVDAVAPGIRVIVGGLTDAPVFLPAMLQAQPGLRGHVDGVAIHPYGAPAAIAAKILAARETLIALGMRSVPLYVTEFGWTTSPPGALDYVPAAQRPADIASALALLGRPGCGVAASLLYTWVTPRRDPGNSQDWFGIAPPQGGGGTTDMAAFAAGLRAAARAGGGPHACGPTTLPADPDRDRGLTG